MASASCQAARCCPSAGRQPGDCEHVRQLTVEPAKRRVTVRELGRLGWRAADVDSQVRTRAVRRDREGRAARCGQVPADHTVDCLVPGGFRLVLAGHLAGVQPGQVVEAVLAPGLIIEQAGAGERPEQAFRLGDRYRCGCRRQAAAELGAGKQPQEPVHAHGPGRQGTVGKIEGAAHRHVILRHQGGEPLPFSGHRRCHLADRPPRPGGEPRACHADRQGQPCAQLRQMASRLRLRPSPVIADDPGKQFHGRVVTDPADLDDPGADRGQGREPHPARHDRRAVRRRREQRGNLRGGQRVVKYHEHPPVDHD